MDLIASGYLLHFLESQQAEEETWMSPEPNTVICAFFSGKFNFSFPQPLTCTNVVWY